MRWQGGRRSTNVVDRRGVRLGRTVGIGGGAVAIVAAIVIALLGGDPSVVLGPDRASDPYAYQDRGSLPVDPAEEELSEFVSVVLADTEDTWPELLEPLGLTYTEPQLVLFTGAVESGCGVQESAVGPFYCPLDSRVYLDLDFFDELERRFGAPGDFAQAYVVAHEIGHHVQNQLGISEQVLRARRRMSPERGNELSVRQELQADCFAGVWAHHAQERRQLLETGDLEEGLAAASAIGDDTLQKRARGYAVPESFTHGTSAQRVGWFRRGLESGSIEACDTFAVERG